MVSSGATHPDNSISNLNCKLPLQILDKQKSQRSPAKKVILAISETKQNINASIQAIGRNMETIGKI